MNELGPILADLLRRYPSEEAHAAEMVRDPLAVRTMLDHSALHAHPDARHRLDFLREPDIGFAWAAWRWAEGDDLDDVLMVTGLSAGDFVRWMKQLLDLCGQVADAAGDSPLRSTARQAAKSLKRGVIAYSVLAE